MTRDRKDIQLRFSNAPAHVLFDLLGRLVEDQNAQQLRELIERDAEIWALYAVYGKLESILSEPFRADYRQAVDSAWCELSAKSGAWPF